MRRLLLIFTLLSIFFTQSRGQITGSRDYALGSSSVMWYPRSSSIFLNPAELGRIHQGEFLLSTNRFSNLSSISATYFQPFIGTFAAGVGVEQNSPKYSLGFGRLIGLYHTVGGAVNVFKDAPQTVTLSLGSAAHFPDSTTQNSGLHGGISLVNLLANIHSQLFGINVGAAYWIKPEFARIQAGWLQQEKGTPVLGVEVRPLKWLSIQLGTRSYNSVYSVYGGLSVPLPYLSLDLAAGVAGISFSVNFRTTDAAADQRESYYESGSDAYDDERYYEAREMFLKSLQYDEYFNTARQMATLAFDTLIVITGAELREARSFEENKNFVEATKLYARVLKMDPVNKGAQVRIKELQPKFRAYLRELIATGDSLRSRRNLERARKVYEQALELDPQNDTLVARMASTGTLMKENLQTSVARAKSHLDKNQLDDAQREYEKVLNADPKNSQAKSGLAAIRIRRATELIEKGKSLFEDGNYAEALTFFIDLNQKDPKNQEVQSYLERTRDALLPEADKFFRAGLQFYVKEDYKAAIDSWNKALLIQPQHPATLEYYKRAEEKLKALEKLQ